MRIIEFFRTFRGNPNKMISAIVAFTLILTASCTKIDDDPKPDFPDTIGKGFFVINQGNFTAGNASLSFFNYDSAKLQNNFFYSMNDVPLGDVGQSVYVWNDNAYIVVNNSGTIWSMDAKTGLIKANLKELHSPRYIQVVDAGKAYVSDMSFTGLTVFNPTTLESLGTINTGKTTENLLVYKEKLFATNWTNYGQDYENNTIQVIDTRFDRLTDSIVVGIEPNSMVLDKHERLWVLCSGGFMEEEFPALYCINPNSLQIEKRFEFPSKSMAPEALAINNTADTLYFINWDLYQMPVNSDALPETAWVHSDNHSFYHIAVDPNNGMILVTDVGNYVEEGHIHRYRYDGTLIDSYTSGILPAHIEFN